MALDAHSRGRLAKNTNVPRRKRNPTRHGRVAGVTCQKGAPMKIALIAAAICALTSPALAQFPETGGVSSQTGPAAKGASAGSEGAVANTNSPAQNGTSAHDNTHGNNSTSPSDGITGTPVPNGEKTVAGTSTTNGSTSVEAAASGR